MWAVRGWERRWAVFDGLLVGGCGCEVVGALRGAGVHLVVLLHEQVGSRMVSLCAVEISCSSLNGESFLSLCVVALCRVVHDLGRDRLLECLI